MRGARLHDHGAVPPPETCSPRGTKSVVVRRCARIRVVREQLSQLRSLTRQVDLLKDELHALISAHRPELLAEVGRGPLTAAILIGRTAGAQRFETDARFARQCGAAPLPCSSGQRTQHRLNRGGDRQLNHTLHIVAITRARHDPETRDYLARKRAEGKSTKGASDASNDTSRDAFTTT
jgi:transposase